MYAGHFAFVPVLKRFYPQTPIHVLTIGVIFLDMVFGFASLFGYEGFELDSHAGVLGAQIHCDYSHSLLGSIILSAVYGNLTGYFVPGFIASFSHFFGDWLVHNEDLLLDPVSKIVVGGTKLWGNYPTLAFYLEIALVLICMALSTRNTRSILAGLFMIFLHISSSSVIPKMFQRVLTSEETYKRLFTCIMINSSFVLPAIAISYIMKEEKAKKN